MIPLSEEENESYEEQDVCHMCEEKFIWMKMMKIMKMRVMRIIKMKITKKLKAIVVIPENLIMAKQFHTS